MPSKPRYATAAAALDYFGDSRASIPILDAASLAYVGQSDGPVRSRRVNYAGETYTLHHDTHSAWAVLTPEPGSFPVLEQP